MSFIPPVVSVILPLTDAATAVNDTLAALAASDLPRRRWELIVVTASARDELLAAAARSADAIVRVGRAWPHGAAYLCNRGAEVARGAVLVFLGEDVIVERDMLCRIDVAFEDPRLDALVGTIGPSLAHGSLPGRYRALAREWAARRSAGATEHFSIACGAVRRTAFFDAGRLDEWQEAPLGCAAAEIGLRLRALGHRIELRADVRATTRRPTGWLDAARPLLLETLPPPWMPRADASDTRTSELRARERRVSALAWAGLASALGATGFRSPVLLMLALALAVTTLAAEAPLLIYVARHGGVAAGIAGLPLRLVSLLAIGAHPLAATVRYRLLGEPHPAPGIEALSEVGARAWPPAPSRARPVALDQTLITPDVITANAIDVRSR